MKLIKVNWFLFAIRIEKHVRYLCERVFVYKTAYQIHKCESTWIHRIESAFIHIFRSHMCVCVCA